MILFKPEHVEPVITGRKTQTRRSGKRRWNVGAEHQCKTKLFGEPFAIVRIVDVREEHLGDISLADVRAEGYENRAGFIDVWKRINKSWDPDLLIWVVEFELAVNLKEDRER